MELFRNFTRDHNLGNLLQWTSRSMLDLLDHAIKTIALTHNICVHIIFKTILVQQKIWKQRVIHIYYCTVVQYTYRL